jgi:type IV pilus assembly protein PilQ
MTACQNQGSVAADSSTNALIITTVASRLDEVVGYVRNLDVRTPQVAIKAKIIFVNRTDIEEIGLSYDIGTRSQFFNRLVQRQDLTGLEPIDVNGDGVPDAYNPTYTAVEGDRIDIGGKVVSAIANAENRVVKPALNVVYSVAMGKYSLTAFLDALQETRLADLQAEPTIVTLDNRRAEILVGQEIPLRVLDANSGGGGGGAGGQGGGVPRATVSLKEAGISLAVTPHITNNRHILMAIHAENSDAQLASSDVGYIFTKQRADNQLLVADGETAVIGGLTVTQVSKQRTGIPILMDLPVVGRLFAVNRTSEAKRDLLILVTPHIVDEGERATPPGNGR